VMVSAEPDEPAMLICNPGIDDDVLVTLYRGQKWAGIMDQDRRRHLIASSALNPRLTSRDDNEFGPDMGHWRLHDAIFEMLETASTSRRWAHTLNCLLSRLDPDHVRRPDEIDTVLERWRVNEIGGADKPKDTHYTDTGFPVREELRCLIGALYGKSYPPTGVVIHGTATDDDVAKRCAFYGNASLTAKDIEEGYKRDESIFVFAAILNDDVYLKKQLRKKFEEDCLNGALLPRYRRRCEQLHKRWKWFDPRPAVEWMLDETPDVSDPLLQKMEQISAETKRLTEKVNLIGSDARGLSVLGKWLPWVIVAITVGFGLRGH